MEIVGEYTNERVVLREKVSIRGRMRWVQMSSVVRCEWIHRGLGSALECGRETPLDPGVKWLVVLALGSPLPGPVAIPVKNAAMEERREAR